MRFLGARIGPFQVWLWLVLVVAAVLAFYVWRKNGGLHGSSSNVGDAPNLTNQSAQLQPYFTDVYVNVTQPVQQPPQATPRPRRFAFTVPLQLQEIVQRKTSMSYPLAAQASRTPYLVDRSQTEAPARMHGMYGGGFIYPQRLVVPT